MASRLNLMVVTTSFPDRNEGEAAAGSFVRDFVAQLSAAARVTVVAPALTASTEHSGDLHIHRFQVPFLPLSNLIGLDPRRLVMAYQSWRAGRQAVLDAAIVSTPDHVIALWALPSGAWAQTLKRRTGVPYSVWCLGSDVWSLAKLPLIRGQLIRVLREAAFRFADGMQLKDDVERLCGCPTSFLASCRVLPGPAAVVPARLPSAPRRLAFLGRWHPNKGVDLLLESLLLLSDGDWRRIENVKIFGGGPLEPQVRKQTARLAARGRPVEVGGYLDRTAAAELMYWADSIILPSRIESIPVIFSDALQARRSVIATPVGDLSRLIQQYQVGWAASACSARSLADTIHGALESKFTTPEYCDFDGALENFSVLGTVNTFLRCLATAT